MTIKGHIEDFAISDALQLLHAGGQTGTLHCNGKQGRIEVVFRNGNIVRAHSDAMTNIGDLLVEAGWIDHVQLKEAVQRQKTSKPRIPLGQVVVDAGWIDAAQLQRIMLTQVEQVVFHLARWKTGEFEFVEAEASAPDDFAVAPNDVIRPEEYDTQQLVQEAMERFQKTPRPPEEPNWFQPPEEEAGGAAPNKPAAAERQHEASAAVVCAGSGAPAIWNRIRAGLGEDRGEWRLLKNEAELDEWLGSGKAAGRPLVIVSAGEGAGSTTLNWLDRTRQASAVPDCWVLGPAADGEGGIEFYRRGVRGVLSLNGALENPQQLGQIVRQLRQIRPAEGEAVERELPRLKAILGAGREDVQSSSITTSFLQLLAGHMRRAVLLLIRNNELRVLSAIGTKPDGTPLTQLLVNLVIPYTPQTSWARCARPGPPAGELIEPGPEWEPLFGRIGIPVRNQALLLRVSGIDRAVALVYGDNGELDKPLQRMDLLEVAAAQVGMVFENLSLRKRLERHEAPRRAAG